MVTTVVLKRAQELHRGNKSPFNKKSPKLQQQTQGHPPMAGEVLMAELFMETAMAQVVWKVETDRFHL